jgi:hypothetical protein
VAFYLQVPEQGLRPTSYHIVKALLTSRKMLLEELNKISGAIGKTVEDLDVADLNLGKYESFNPSKSWLPNSSKVFPETGKGVGQLAGILHDFLEVCFILCLRSPWNIVTTKAVDSKCFTSGFCRDPTIWLMVQMILYCILFPMKSCLNCF